MMASKPVLSSMVQLAESTSPPNSTSAVANKTKERQRRYYIRMLHKVVDEANVLLVLIQLGAVADW
jgi:hypothetical protein